jgi:chromosomal replication initiator protein
MNYYAMPALKKAGVKNSQKTDVIIQAVVNYYCIDPELLYKRTRLRRVVAARQMVMYILRERTTLSLDQIGKIFNRDHTTVIHACKMIEDRTRLYEEEREDYQLIMSTLYNQHTDVGGHG